MAPLDLAVGCGGVGEVEDAVDEDLDRPRVEQAPERRELISKRTEELARLQEGTAIVPPSLLDEVTALVEWPVPLIALSLGTILVVLGVTAAARRIRSARTPRPPSR